MMEAARTSETLVNFYQTTWCYNPEDSHLHYSLVYAIGWQSRYSLGQKTFFAVVFAACCSFYRKILFWMAVLSRGCHTNFPPSPLSVRCHNKMTQKIQLLEAN
jgi:hypothetical protein